MSATKLPIKTEMEARAEGESFKQVEAGKFLPFLAFKLFFIQMTT